MRMQILQFNLMCFLGENRFAFPSERAELLECLSLSLLRLN
jgi:hypothetical protein